MSPPPCLAESTSVPSAAQHWKEEETSFPSADKNERTVIARHSSGWRAMTVFLAYRFQSAKRQIGIWRRVAADNALRTASGHSTSFGPLDRNCVGCIEQTTTAKTNRARSGWKDYHPGEVSHCPWGHPHKFQFIFLLSQSDMHSEKMRDRS